MFAKKKEEKERKIHFWNDEPSDNCRECEIAPKERSGIRLATKQNNWGGGWREAFEHV